MTGVGTINTNPVFSQATDAEYQANTAGAKALTPEKVWLGVDYTALTDAASIAVNMGAGFNFSVSIAGNRTLANPTNPKVGQSGCFKVTASGASRTIAVGTNYFSTTTFPVTIAAASQICYLFYYVDTTTRIIITGVVNNPT